VPAPDELAEKLDAGAWRAVRDDAEPPQVTSALGPVPIEVASPRAAAGIALAAPRLRARDFDALETLVPRYLRLSEAERKLST
jgi:tRNA A37 threonylcarbamoyladenosine modification protein TsaB